VSGRRTAMQMKGVLFHMKERFTWFARQRELNAMTRMEEFQNYITAVQPAEFLRYQALSQEKRTEFQTVMNELDVNLKGIAFLDIGPAYGDSLDICHEQGAARIEFIEIDPYFFTYNQLKGYARGYNVDHLLSLHRLDPGKYDVIWAKGSVSVDFFINKRMIVPNLSRWLEDVERLAAPSCTIIICPHWSNDTHTRRIENIHCNAFTHTMLVHGYELLPPIRLHNHEPEYPCSFFFHRAPPPVPKQE
jgi:hypothetical protein